MSAQRRVLDYYARASTMTEAAARSAAFCKLPDDPRPLMRIVQGLTIHEFVATPMYGVQVPDDRRFEAHLRSTVSMLDRIEEIDSRALDVARAPGCRLVGNCHHYAVLYMAMLRAKGIPVRARWGFGAYFNPPWFEDHVNCEVWDAAQSRWRLAEPQLDEHWTAQPGFDFDTMDVPRDRFLTASDAWTRCRRGETDPQRFGIFHGNQRGYWFIAGSLVKDVAALNKVETLPWDVWGAMPPPNGALTNEQFAYFDRLAELTADPDRHFDELRTTFAADDGLRVPDLVFNALTQQQEPLYRPTDPARR
jgi:hypothetical protein